MSSQRNSCCGSALGCSPKRHGAPVSTLRGYENEAIIQSKMQTSGILKGTRAFNLDKNELDVAVGGTWFGGIKDGQGFAMVLKTSHKDSIALSPAAESEAERKLEGILVGDVAVAIPLGEERPEEWTQRSRRLGVSARGSPVVQMSS